MILGVCGLLMLALFCPLASAAEETEAQRQEAILKEVRALHEAVDKLKLGVEALEKKVGGTAPTGAVDRPVPDAEPWLPKGFQKHGPDLEALGKIALPANFTKDQAREYVRKILAASHDQNYIGPDDPQVAMLGRVGPDNLDVLIDGLQDRGLGSWYVEQAIHNLVRPESKAQILAALDRYPALAQIVIEQGWEADARDILINKLKTETGQLEPEWMQAAVNLHSPEAYDALKQYLIQGEDRTSAFAVLFTLHDAGDLGPTVAKAWEAAKSGYGRKSMAQIAFMYGHVDALGDVIGQLSDPTNDAEDTRAIRFFLNKYIPGHADDADLAGWFAKNEANIVWDPEANVYRVKGETPKPAEAARPAK